MQLASSWEGLTSGWSWVLLREVGFCRPQEDPVSWKGFTLEMCQLAGIKTLKMVSGGHCKTEAAIAHAWSKWVVATEQGGRQWGGRVVWHGGWITHACPLLSRLGAGQGTQTFSLRWSNKIAVQEGQVTCQESEIFFPADAHPSSSLEDRLVSGPGGCVTIPSMPRAQRPIKSCGPRATHCPGPHLVSVEYSGSSILWGGPDWPISQPQSWRGC